MLENALGFRKIGVAKCLKIAEVGVEPTNNHHPLKILERRLRRLARPYILGHFHYSKVRGLLKRTQPLHDWR